MEHPPDAFDRSLLALTQRRIPLVREPYAQIAAEVGCPESRALERLAAMRGPGGPIREVSAVFDSQALGYRQALVAFRVPDDRLDAAGALVAEHPGVSHCYARSAGYNLWFTLACSPTSRLGLDRTAQLLAERCGASGRMILPTLRRYKLDVRFAQTSEGEVDPDQGDVLTSPERERRVSADLPLSPSPEQVRAIQALQIDLPNRSDPFAPLAASAEMTPDMLLVHAADFLSAGWMRRYAAVLRHRVAGAEANLLVAWRVDEAQADLYGPQCARFRSISHCYLRPAGPDWPWNLYTMIHGRTEQDCRMTVEEILATTSLGDRQELWTLREYKKARVPLFGPQENQWEARQQSPDRG